MLQCRRTTGGTGAGLTVDTTIADAGVITVQLLNHAGSGYTQFDSVTLQAAMDATVRIIILRSLAHYYM